MSNPPPTLPPAGDRIRPGLVLLSTGLATFAVFLDTTIGFVSFPAISRTFRAAGPDTVSWVLNAYTLVFAALLIPSGRLADRFGRKRMFLIGVVTFTTGSMLCGISPTVWTLIAAEMLEAVGAAILVPASLALVLQTFPREKVPFAVAIWGAIGAVAGAAGPTIGSLVVSGWGWRWAFFINLPVGIGSFFLATRVLPEGSDPSRGRLPDLSSVAMLCGGVAAITYGIVKSSSWGWADTGTSAWIVAGVAILTSFVIRSRRVDNPVVHASLFHLNGFRWANAATIVFAIGFNAMFLGNVLFLTQVWGYSILRAGLAVSVGPAVVACTAPFFGKLAGRIGQRRLLVPGGVVWASGGLWLLSRADVAPSYASIYLPATLLTGLGVALCLPQLSSAAVQGLPPTQLGTGSAVGQAVRNLGATVGVALVIAFTAGATPGTALDAFHRVWWLLVASGLLVSLCSTRLHRHPSPAGQPIDHTAVQFSMD